MSAVLEVRDVSKKIGKKLILDHVSFSIEPGEVVGLVGPNGAGKTSLMKLIAGYNFPTGGSISICGYDVKRSHAEAMRLSSFLIEEPGLYPQLSGKKHVQMVLDSRNFSRDQIDSLSDLLNFGSQINNRTKTYSIGMKQRLGLALCWAARPALMVLDEPLNGLDPDGIFLLREKIELAAKNSTAILISSHLLSELQKSATRFVFLNHGKVVGTGNAGDQDELEKTYRRLLSPSENGTFPEGRSNA